MSITWVGQKRGMTRYFMEDGKAIPVTVVELSPMYISQIKSEGSYHAVQIAYGSKRPSLIKKPLAGLLKKAGIESCVGLKEFRVQTPEELEGFEVGAALSTEELVDGLCVDVEGTSKGKGFAGVVKRHNFAMQDATHGNSVSHRAHGSTGQCQEPGRVFKGKKMAGQMGNVKCTSQGLTVVSYLKEKNAVLIKGAVPGANNGYVSFKKSSKAKSNGEKS